MGSNQFQREYIEYLQERNAELIGKLNHMKESYENKILSKDLKKHYLMSALEDVLRLCTQMPQDIDLFFDKMSGAMDLLKNILLRKSEMLQLVEKISKIVNTTEDQGADLIALDTSSLLKEPIAETRNKRTGTVRVAPMINGHVISTEPRIYLSRVPDVFTPRTRFDVQQLSPIIEASPNNSAELSNQETHGIRDVTIPLERINLKKMSFNYRNEESPRSRFKGPKTWKKSLSSTKHQSENGRVPLYVENKETINKKFPVGEIENLDPLEGPSWLYNENEGNTSLSCFTDYRRRKHRFATVFDKNEDYNSSDAGKELKSQHNENEDRGNNNVNSNDKNYENVVEDDIEKVMENEVGNAVGSVVEDGIKDEIEDGTECDDNHDDNKQLYGDHKNPNFTKVEQETEFQNIINETSEDLFYESYSGEKSRESTSQIFKASSSSASKNAKDGNVGSKYKNSAESENNFTLEMMTCDSVDAKNKSAVLSKQPRVSEKRNNETCEPKKSKKSKKCHSKCRNRSSSGDTDSGASVKKTSLKTEHANKKNTSECMSGFNENEEDMLIKDALEKKVFVRLENYISQPEVVTERFKTKIPTVKVSLSDLKNPAKSSEMEGRKKRKAAPTLKLVEPSLRVKLRRS